MEVEWRRLDVTVQLVDHGCSLACGAQGKDCQCSAFDM